MEMGPSPGGRGGGKPPSPQQSPLPAPNQGCPWGSPVPTPPPLPAGTAPLPGTALHFSHGSACSPGGAHTPKLSPTALFFPKGWPRDRGVTAGLTLLSRDNALHPGMKQGTLLPLSQNYKQEWAPQPACPLKPLQPRDWRRSLPPAPGCHTYPTARRKWYHLSACHSNLPAWILPQPCSSWIPCVFSGESPPSTGTQQRKTSQGTWAPSGRAFRGAECLQFPAACSVEQSTSLR